MLSALREHDEVLGDTLDQLRYELGQKKSVTYVALISPGTIDEKIVEALRNKINLADQVLKEDTKNWLA